MSQQLDDQPSFAPPRAVIVRGVAGSFDRALRTDTSRAIDVPLARIQHAAYVRAIESMGIEIVRVPADESCPDCCFIEDTAVVTGVHAVLTNQGADVRRGESAAVRPVLDRWCTVHEMEPAATLDGGDVLRVGGTLFVGITERTNRAGAWRLMQVAASEGLKTILIEVGKGLHLKSSCTLAAPDLVLFTEGAIDRSPFLNAGLRCLAVAEPCGSNVLAIGRTVLVSSQAPATAAVLREQAGTEVRVLDVSEFHKADGALTCLSIRIPVPGMWCT